MKLPIVFLLAVLCLPYIINSQDRTLTYQSPIPFTPEAYAFFHPNTQEQNTRNENLCDSSQSDCSDQLPTASNLAYESLSPPQGGGLRLGGGMTGIPIGLVFAILLGLVILVVVITRNRNAKQANNAQLTV
ncbi:hypothetical protein P3S67_009223 [Capsicum chacoense]|uniref:uncharacterized protein LOC107873835 n=1 Tax=Capsicum annuum TaxID=4072 RepID=UPI0007BFE0A7|nr:uncharacterized protein LOC107873835 [Capsicum annuum]KAF3679950.1 hypothetical protein FXO37_03570 [Capsicum annuum]